MRLIILTTVCAALAAVGCKKDDRTSGLPPATEWNAPIEDDSPTTGGMANPHEMANPHGMMDPHGMDPHAGLDMGGGIAEESGLPPPDPNQAVDPSKYLKGVIVATDETKALIKPGYAVFLSVKPYDPSTKGPAKMPPIAVDKMDNAVVPAPFHLTQAQAMVGGTQFGGDVVITAHVSQTGDAMTKAPGDIVGMARATIPADEIEIVLDTVIQ